MPKNIVDLEIQVREIYARSVGCIAAVYWVETVFLPADSMGP